MLNATEAAPQGEHWTHKDVDAAYERGRQLERDLVVTNLSEYEVGKEFESHREGGQTLFFQLSAGTRRAICSTVNVFRKKCNVAAPQEVDFVVLGNEGNGLIPISNRAHVATGTQGRWRKGSCQERRDILAGLYAINWTILLDKNGGGK